MVGRSFTRLQVARTSALGMHGISLCRSTCKHGRHKTLTKCTKFEEQAEKRPEKKFRCENTLKSVVLASSELWCGPMQIWKIPLPGGDGVCVTGSFCIMTAFQVLWWEGKDRGGWDSGWDGIPEAHACGTSACTKSMVESYVLCCLRGYKRFLYDNGEMLFMPKPLFLAAWVFLEQTNTN